MRRELLALDLETHLIQPGLLSPPIVCLSWAKGKSSGLLADKAEIRAFIVEALASTDVLVGANVAYDFGCILAAWPELLPQVWAACEASRVRDVQIRATLVAISEGRLRDGELFARNGSKMTNSEGRITDRYSLDVCVKEWLGRTDAKENDEWRLRYAELDGRPLEEWPLAARQYPIDDAVNTLQVAEAQGDREAHNEPQQCHAALCAHLSAMWGLRTDPEKVEALKANIGTQLAELRTWAVRVGILRADGTKDTKGLAARVSAAYAGAPPTTPKGAPSTSRETLESSGDPTLVKFAAISGLAKLETYLPTLEEAARVPLNVKPNILLATGRTSYQGLIQIMPRKGGVRECFRFRGVGSSVDYAAIELVTLAQCQVWLLGRSTLGELPRPLASRSGSAASRRPKCRGSQHRCRWTK